MPISSLEKNLDQISPGRRRLLKWLTGGFLSLWGVGFAWVISSFLKPPQSKSSLAERVIKVGPDDSMAVGQALLVRRGRDPIFVIRTGEDTWIGLSAVCTHLHCVLQWDSEEEHLNCPCHRGAFDTNGNVLHGPARSGLQRYRVETRLGEIYLHLT